MRENLVQTGSADITGRRYIEYDWYSGGIPANVQIAENVYLDTSYGFAAYHSECETGLEIGEGSGTYDRASFVVGKKGRVSIGKYTVLNGTTIIANESVEIGSHCLLAWGSVVTDGWDGDGDGIKSLEQRREALGLASAEPERYIPEFSQPRPVVIEDNVWIGFDTVILGGVRIGRGAIIGCKTVITEDVPPYAVMVGNPARLIRFLEPDDTEDAIKQAFLEHSIFNNE